MWLASLASAQSGLAGKGQYPQARSLSGLSGGGAAVASDGAPTMRGALTLSTPIGYTIGHGRAILIGGATSSDSRLRWFDGEVSTNGSNGTAAFIFGAGLGQVGMSVSLVQTSRLSEDRVVNLQFSPTSQPGRLGVSFGVQDLFDQTETTPNYHESAQSYFFAATYDVGARVYATAGTGTKRFSKGFASLSAPILPRTRAMAENDGYGWNYGLGLDLFDSHGDGTTQTTLFLGYTQGRYATWALSMRF